jgi:hydrogenase expression/formation protein HypC
MCLGIPVRIIKIEGDKAEVETGGIFQTALLTLLPDVQVGDYILLHAGFAIQKIDEQEAKETLRLLESLT